MKYQLIKPNIHLISTNQFKTINIAIRISAPLSRSDATYRALLPFVLKSGTKRYPNKKAINQYLESLYGAQFDTGIYKIGLVSIIHFNLTIVNPKYIGHDILDEGLAFLSEVIYNPKISRQVFSGDIVKMEKRLLREELKSINDNKTRYSAKKLIQLMCQDELSYVESSGYLKDISQINATNLYNYYQKVLQTNNIDFCITGNFAKEKVVESIINYFNYPHQYQKYQVLDVNQYLVNNVKEVIEYQQINQAKLNVGYRTYTKIKDQDYYAMMVFNGLFGRFPHAKLYVNIREKQSLAYHISSRYDIYRGLIIIDAGIDTNKYKQVLAIIQSELVNIQNGLISEEEIIMTKKNLINDILESLDVIEVLGAKVFNNLLLERKLDDNLIIDAINAVSREDIIVVSQKLVLDSIFLLAEKGVKVDAKN